MRKNQQYKTYSVFSFHFIYILENLFSLPDPNLVKNYYEKSVCTDLVHVGLFSEIST